MAVEGLSIFSVLKSAMSWRQARQKLLADNVANANTVGYRARDLAPLDFRRSMAAPVAAPLQVTDPAHLSAGKANADATFAEADADGFETTPDGNGVTLEEQMMRLGQNQIDYELAIALYTKSLGLIKTAIGRK